MTCGACGAANPAGSRFCSSCGHPLVTRSDERRVATVLFADLVGFTALAESSDPEQVKNLVDRCFARLARDITDFGGQVDKILGDAIIALFGAPVAHEDDAERAVRAALRMQETLARYAADLGAEVRLRIGVNTGEVLVGSLRAGGEYTAMGDVVNIAQRLQTIAEPGAVVVGAATYAATRDAIEYRSLGEVRAKGRDEPVQAWVAVEPLLPPGYRRRRQETPFVGREAELGVLSHALDAAVARSRAHLLLVVGEAGVGKSRLAEEVARQARSCHQAMVLEGRCVPYGEANVWWPLAEALRQGCSISQDDPLPEADRLAVVAVAAALDQPTAAPEVKRVVNGLLYLMGYEVSLRDIEPQRAREEAVRSVLLFVDGIARQRPVVLVLSDLHWADPLVLEVVDALLDRLVRSRFVLIATARQELHERWQVPYGRHNGVVLNLDPLDRAATAELLGSIVERDLPADLRDALLDRSGGNPFFLEELVALLADADHAPAEMARPDAGPLSELPDTLRGLVSARIDGLTNQERAVLEDASVWGRTGPVLALERMAGEIHGLADVRSLLTSLVDKEILSVEGERWAFHSDLIREVAYGTLTKADRARRHCGIAAYLEHQQPNRHEASDRTVDVIAYHYGAAAELIAELGSVDGVPTEPVRRAALGWIEEAAHRASVAQVLPVSVRLFSQALRIVDPADADRRVRYLLGRAAAETDRRALDAARADLAEADVLLDGAADDHLQARIVLARGELEQAAGDLEAALTTLGEAAERFTANGDHKGLADARRVLGLTHLYRGAYGEAEASIRAALAASREVGDRRGEAWALQNLAWISFIEGRPDEAEARLTASADTFGELGDTGGLSWALGLLAFVRFQQGRLDEAGDLGAQILREARDRGDRWGEGMMLLLAAGVRLWSGRSGEAVEAARQAVDVFAAIGDRFGEAQATASLGRALVTSGRVREGLDLLGTAADGVHAGALNRDTHLFLAMGLAGAAAQVGDPERALRVVAVPLDDELLDGSIGDGERRVSEALALLQLGRVEAATDLLLGVVDTGSGHEPSPYARAVLSLADAVAGRDDDALATADLLLASTRSTYSDRALAGVTRLLVQARRHAQGVGHEAAELVAELDEVDDPVARAVVRLAAASATGAVDDPAAERWREDAETRLAELGIDAGGWRTLFGLVLTAPTPAELTPD